MSEIEASEDNTIEFDFTNTKLKEAIIHYYEKGTGEKFGNDPHKIKEDEHIYGEIGKEYDTTKNISIELEGGYTLELNKENNYIIPDNATGYFEDESIDIYYYYEKINNKLTDISARKQWQMPEEEANNYRATLKLVSIVNGNIIPAVDNNGDEITRIIQGNGSAVFKDIKQYEDGQKVEYKVQEVKIEKLESINNETQEEIWVEVPLNQFKVMYGIEE